MGIHEGFTGRYWSVKGGKFVHTNKQTGEVRTCTGLSGVLSRISVKYDAGDAARNIAPGHKLNVSLEEGGEIEVISCKVETTFGWMLAQSLSAVDKGEDLLVETSAGDNEKICFAWVKRYTGGVKSEIERPKYPEDQHAKHARALEDLMKHPALHKEAETADPDYDPYADDAPAAPPTEEAKAKRAAYAKKMFEGDKLRFDEFKAACAAASLEYAKVLTNAEAANVSTEKGLYAFIEGKTANQGGETDGDWL